MHCNKCKCSQNFRNQANIKQLRPNKKEIYKSEAQGRPPIKKLLLFNLLGWPVEAQLVMLLGSLKLTPFIKC